MGEITGVPLAGFAQNMLSFICGENKDGLIVLIVHVLKHFLMETQLN